MITHGTFTDATTDNSYYMLGTKWMEFYLEEKEVQSL